MTLQNQVQSATETTVDQYRFLREMGLAVVKTQTKPTRPGKQPKDIWEISGVNLRKYEPILRDEMGLKMWKGKFTSWVDPVGELCELVKANEGLSIGEIQEYAAERSEVRAERLEDRAEHHAKVSDELWERGRQMMDGVPFGQPILVGHHSERGHRNLLKKTDNICRKSVGEHKYAKELERRSEGAERRARMKSAETCTLEYAGNRLKEAKAELNTCDRSLTIQPLDFAIYRGPGQDYQGMRVQVRVIKGNRCGVCVSVPEGVSGSDWSWPKISCNLEDLESYLSEDRRLDLQNRKANAIEAIDFWTEIVKQKGGEQYSSLTIKKGDWVEYWDGIRQVVRVNQKTVTVQTQYSWTDKVEYTKLRRHMTAEQYAELNPS
jgi:hypothetical protein